MSPTNRLPRRRTRHQTRRLSLAAVALTASTLSTAFLPLKPATAQDLPVMPIQFNPDAIENPGRPGGRRRGGGSRGGCRADRPLSAIAYAESTITEELGVTSTSEIVGSLTTQSNPMLWFYLPDPLEENAAQLIIQNSNDESLFEGQLIGETSDSGLVGVPMPITLEPGEAYHWSLTLECDESESNTVDGWLERRIINADLNRTFQQANARNRVALYVNYGFVQDALGELAAMRSASPDDEAISQEWGNFLRTLGFEDLTEVALLDCCQVANMEAPDVEITNNEEVEESDAAVSDPTVSDPSDATPEEEPKRRTVLQRARDRG